MFALPANEIARVQLSHCPGVGTTTFVCQVLIEAASDVSIHTPASSAFDINFAAAGSESSTQVKTIMLVLACLLPAPQNRVCVLFVLDLTSRVCRGVSLRRGRHRTDFLISQPVRHLGGWFGAVRSTASWR